MAFLPDTDAEGAAALLSAIREDTAKYSVSNCTLSVSLGCSTMRRGDSLIRCIEKADDQMYLDKQAYHGSRQ